MLKIEAVQTQAGYIDALTFGPDNFTTISLEVWNASCAVQVFQLSSHGHHQTGEWSDELILSPSTFTFTRCGGIRVRTNPKTGTPAVINAWAVKAADPSIVAGAQNQGTLSPSSGSFSPPVTTFPYAAYVPAFDPFMPPNLGVNGSIQGWFTQIGGGLVHTFGIAEWLGAGKTTGSSNYSISLPVAPTIDGTVMHWAPPIDPPFSPQFVPAAGAALLSSGVGLGFVPATPAIISDQYVLYGNFFLIYQDPATFPSFAEAGPPAQPFAWANDGDSITWNFVYRGIQT